MSGIGATQPSPGYAGGSIPLGTYTLKFPGQSFAAFPSTRVSQNIGNAAASTQLATPGGSIVGFSSAASNGVLLAAVFCSQVESSPTAYSMSGGGLTWSLVAAYLNGPLGPIVGQSIYLFAAPFSALINGQTFTLTNNGQNSGHFGFILIEAQGSQNVYDPGSSLATQIGNSTSMTAAPITTANANDMILGLCFALYAGTDVISGSGGYSTAISTSNFSASIGAAAALVYLLASGTGTYTPTANNVRGGPWVMCAIAIEASGGGTTSGKILATQPLGAIKGSVVLSLSHLSLSGHFATAYNPTTFGLKLVVRDATAMPNVTLAQALAATSAGSFATTPSSVTGAGNYVGVAVELSRDYEAYAGGAGRNTDDYGNAISPGDSLVADLVVSTSQAATGTYDAGADFAALFIP